eukprot:690060-Hanusia_phi.AAC.1
MKTKTRASAQWVVHDLPLQLSRVEVVVEAANFTPEEDCWDKGGEWKPVELGRIVEEMVPLPGAEELQLAKDLKPGPPGSGRRGGGRGGAGGDQAHPRWDCDWAFREPRCGAGQRLVCDHGGVGWGKKEKQGHNVLNDKLRCQAGSRARSGPRPRHRSPQGAFAEEQKQEADDEVTRRSLSLLLYAMSKYVKEHEFVCYGKVDSFNRLGLVLMEPVDMGAEGTPESEAGSSGPYRQLVK